jgi:hypothetical protein
MPKKSVAPSAIEKAIMAKVKTNELVMKPRWYFVLGSLSLTIGLIATTMAAVFLTNVTLFLMRQHGPNWQWRLQSMLSNFPWWMPILAVVGVVAGLWMLKHFDFSYKKNFALIAASFIAAIILAAWTIDILGLGQVWFMRGPMRRYLNDQPGRHMQQFPGSGGMRYRQDGGGGYNRFYR